MQFNVANEVAVIVGRKLSGIERMYVRSKTGSGMVNPYDVIAEGRKHSLFN